MSDPKAHMTIPAPGKGLDIAREYWTEWGRSWLASRYADLLSNIGVGLFSGSDVLCADDALSRDHGWGPRFDVFRVDEDGISNESLQSEMRNAAPAEWSGVRNRFQFTPSIQVHTACEYFGSFFTNHRLPESLDDWVCCRNALANLESHLHYIRHGAVFYDPKGILGDIQAKLRNYPEDIWFLRMAQLCYDVAHYGEYNFCWRLAKRKDPIASEIAIGNFQHAVMALAIVMDHDYAPYWKWIHHVFQSCAIAGQLDAYLFEVSTTIEYERRATLVTSICKTLMKELVKRDIVPEDLDDGSGLPLFFQAQAYLTSRIGDSAIKALMR
ncbi:DUF4037 domain-containing protein [Pseudodesulfovibrio sp. F-1]|uniref:DUF4037 domain-containing protein n=1 Tax=Pseudodesulfovibrio alkaliphilus TaxID=2661613 RepID=A0A7K1KIU8_9BACT|nr:DUF4037 domain-containing protein [Pseudodesulfovibrio alkaliphilus]MUM76013.1 DUF4037 domain-containing protein [Pseudodesulfovibrio alkaliphilus]